MASISLDLAKNPTDFSIRLHDCPAAVQTFVASLVSSRWSATQKSFIAHVDEFRKLKEYLDVVGIAERDSSDEVMDRVISWNRGLELDLKIKAGEFNIDVQPEYLSPIKTKLYKDQTSGVRFLTSRYNSLLADSMGIGKSLEAITTFSVLKSLRSVERALVVCISTVKPGWRKEIYKHSSFSVTVLPNGTNAILEAIEKYKEKPTDFLITHYESLCEYKQSKHKVLDADHGNSAVIQSLLGCNFDIVIADEIHLLKNMESVRYKSFNYLYSNLKPSSNLVEVEYETESGEIVKRILSDNAAMHLDVGDEVNIV